MRILAWLSVLVFFAKVAKTQHAIIPAPLSYKENNTSFLLNEQVSIVGYDESFFIQQKIEAITHILPRGENTKRVILFSLQSTDSNSQSYWLKVTADTVFISASCKAAQLYALHTLLQNFNSKNNTFIGCEVIDKPLFPYRAMHLDVSRHFFNKTIVKQYIALLASLKMNTLHLHLTDDQGWRIEIKQYPLLTQIGAWRKEKDGSNYGGFFTQDDLREIVSYATLNGVEIIPEIEMPGHASAAIAAYPFLSCHRNAIEVPNTWGIKNDILCPTDSTLQFFKNVLNEVCEIFPSKFIHIGGDEVPKTQWQQSLFVQQLMQEKKLKNYTAVHAYIIQEIEKHLTQKGKRIIAWGEVMRGYVSDSVVVMSWKSKAAGNKATKLGKQAIMAPRLYCYFDYPQNIQDKKNGKWMVYTPLKKTYCFTPYSKHLSPQARQFIIGGEAAVWTEHIATEQQLLHQIMPRLAAISEALWSHQKDFKDFERRLQLLLNPQ
ncbi:MAG: beta-N-acetylhexosaminidase [Chitinophagales bacterium]|nr:beta-N-acetylhexosaminidase [Chitinophagales bacterium]